MKPKFFDSINKIDKTLTRLIKRRWKSKKTASTKNERGDITTDSTDIKRIIKEYYEQYANKLDNLDKMDKFFQRHKLPKFIQKINSLVLYLLKK